MKTGDVDQEHGLKGADGACHWMPGNEHAWIGLALARPRVGTKPAWSSEIHI